MFKRLNKWFPGALHRLLVYRYLPLLSAVLGMLFGLPTLWTGWGYSDDLIQRGILLTSNLKEAITRLYLFMDPAINSHMMNSGVFPWWTLPDAKVFFFRPLSAFSLWVDYQLWPNSSAMMHLHSLLWYGALCVLAAVLYRRFAGNTPSTGLALLLFALSTAHIGAVISLAARNLLMTAFFGFLAIYFHDRWRRDDWVAGLFFSLLCIILGLLSAESGVAVFAYLFAYELFLDKDKRFRRWFSLVPAFIIIVGWWISYSAAGFGTWGSGFYLNPVREPLTFLVAVIERAPMLLLGQWITPDPVTYAVFSSGGKFIYWALGIIILVFIGTFFVPLYRKDRNVRFWTIGMLVSVIPVCSVSPPSGRHLIFISFGVFGLMGHFIVGRFTKQDWLKPGKYWQTASLVICIVFLSIHGLIYPTLGPVVRGNLDDYSTAITEIGDIPGIASKDLVIVNAPSTSLFIYLPAIRASEGLDMPAHLRVLAPGYSAVTITRLDETTLLVTPDEGYLLSPNAQDRWPDLFLPILPIYSPSYGFRYGDQLFRGDDYPMQTGQLVKLDDFQAHIDRMTADERPYEVTMQFSKSLGDASFIWLAWDWQTYSYVPFTLPAVGETVRVSGPF